MGIQLLEKNVFARLNVQNRKEAFRIILQHAADQCGVMPRVIHEALLLQEDKALLGIGDGVALPHARVRGLKEPVMIFARLEKPIEFDSVDGRPVDLICTLLSPHTEAEAFHLRRLSRISRMMRDSAFLKRLRGTDKLDALYVQLVDPVERSLAA